MIQDRLHERGRDADRIYPEAPVESAHLRDLAAQGIAEKIRFNGMYQPGPTRVRACWKSIH